MPPSPDRPLPTGTVTFLFTDIEGSTRLLTTLGQAYDGLLATHSAILRRGISSHGGTEVGTEGDAFFAVFPSAIDAVRAATAAQRELWAEPWPEGATLRVRMGLHSGEGRLGGDSYVGLDVHRAARISAAGHGGQVLLSDATRVLAAQDLPEGVGLRDLSQHRLKDLPAPERIWQLDIEGLQVDFPTIRSLDARPNNLPLSATSLIGRERQLAEISELVRQHRLVTLAGPAGTGKTRLGLAAAQHLLADFGDGAFFIGLEDARDRPTVAAMVAAAVGVREGVREKAGRDLEEGVREFTSGREVLFVLDNFEQVLAAAPLVASLLAGSPRLRIIVTSRSPLHLSGEQEYAVPPLGLPDLAHLPPLAALSQYESVALFIERATAVKSDFAVTNANAPAIAEICSRLDGLPLAIELAAARIKLLSPQAILERLVQRLPLLDAGPADLPARQRTLRSAMDWSYELLNEAERRFFERVAVFAGGWAIEACDEVVNPGRELGIDTLEGLTSLADKSLIRPADGDEAEPRFAMLQVVREFATERREAGQDDDAIRRRHAVVFRDLAEQAEPELIGNELRGWQRRVRREEDNIRASLGWAVKTGDAEIGLRTASALWRFWQYWAEFREGRRWLESLLALPSASAPSAARAKALSALGSINYWQGDAERAAELYDEALRLYRQIGDDRQIADALFNSAWAAVGQNDIAGTVGHANEAIEHYRRANDPRGAIRVTAFLRTGAYLMGGGGSMEDALAAASEAVDVSRQLGRLYDVADWVGSLGFVYFRAGDDVNAHATFRDGVRIMREMENVGMLPFLQVVGSVELRLGRPERAVRLAAAAARAVEEIGGQLPAAMIGDTDPMEQARSLLPEDVFARAVEEGRAMTFEQATAYAIGEADASRGG